jgi:hypothetical protein
VTTKTITLPPATAARLEALVTQQQAISAVIEATIATLREALDVPAEYQLRNVHDGFVAPPNAPTEGNE